MRKIVLVFLILCFFGAVPLFAEHRITVVNLSDHEIKGVSLFSYYDYKWSGNLLTEKTMVKGDRISISISDCGYFDFKIQLKNGDVYYIEEIWLCGDTSRWNIENSMFRKKNKE